MGLGGVPMSVSMPPMLPAKASGISRRDCEKPPERHRLTTIGSISATVPVLLTKAPTNDVASITSTNSRVSLPPASPIILRPARPASPVLKMPSPTTNSPAIMMTMGLAKPANASSGDKMPQSTSESAVHTATRSERMRPLTNKMAERQRIMIVTVMFQIKERGL